MAMKEVPLHWRFLILGCGLLIAAGCSGGPSFVTVSGKVTLGDELLTTGGVSFIADESKGNKARGSSRGWIGADGSYELHSIGVTTRESGKGAQLGWYKVILVEKMGKKDLESKIDAKYFDENTTPLFVEVVNDPAPGRYDFKVSKK
jgi:hypothetical protein